MIELFIAFWLVVCVLGLLVTWFWLGAYEDNRLEVDNI